jgi:hypothetical protein
MELSFQRLKAPFLAAVLCVLASAATLNAATISILSPGDNRVTLFTDSGGGFLNVDVRGLAYLSVSTPGADVVLVDDLSGANNSPFPNSTLLGINPGFTEAMGIFLDFSHGVFGPTDLLVPVLVAPLTPITDPNLAALLAVRSLTYNLAIGPVDLAGSIAYQYDLAAVNTAIPEPAHLGIGGLLLLAGLGRLRRRANAK